MIIEVTIKAKENKVVCSNAKLFKERGRNWSRNIKRPKVQRIPGHKMFLT